MLGPLANIFLVSSTFFCKDDTFFNKIDNLFLMILILLSPSLILFSAATDWGRWVNITYTFSVLLYFFLIKNNYLYTSSNLLFFDNHRYLNPELSRCIEVEYDEENHSVSIVWQHAQLRPGHGRIINILWTPRKVPQGARDTEQFRKVEGSRKIGRKRTGTMWIRGKTDPCQKSAGTSPPRRAPCPDPCAW